MKLNIEFTHFWHCGSGRSGGKKVDALVEKDSNGIAYVPGKTLKGILREAVRQAESYGTYLDLELNITSTIESIIFGSREQERDKQVSGILAVTDACLSDGEIDYLVNNKSKIELLYRNINQTAINKKTGTAINGSLRGQEVTIPVMLGANIELMNVVSSDNELSKTRQLVSEHIVNIISKALPFVDGIGHLRQRGLGRCILKLEA